jgi:hypothetical protein
MLKIGVDREGRRIVEWRGRGSMWPIAFRWTEPVRAREASVEDPRVHRGPSFSLCVPGWLEIETGS